MWVLDATAKVPAGLLLGKSSILGSYDECLAITLRSENDIHRTEFRGQYCIIRIWSPLPKINYRHLSHKAQILNFSSFGASDTIVSFFQRIALLSKRSPFRFGICIPSTCSIEDLQQMLEYGRKNFEVDANVAGCEVQEDRPLDATQITVIVIFTVLLLIAAVATLCDVKLSDHKKFQGPSTWKILECFSVRNSLKSLNVGGNGRLDVMDGIRVFTIVWITAAHVYGLMSETADYTSNMEKWLENHTYMLMANPWTAVDIFFVISGTLLSYSTLQTIEKEASFQYGKSVMKRLWRLTPPVWSVVGVLFLLSLVGSGPFWMDNFMNEVEKCRRHWWGAIFYLNSWLDYDSMCLVNTWYVSADLHLYVVGLVVIYSLHRNRIFGIILSIVLMTTSALIVAMETYFYDLPPTIMFTSLDFRFVLETMSITYLRFYTHMSPYLLGVLLGFIIQRNKEITISTVASTVCWCLSAVLFASPILGARNWFNGIRPEPWVAAVYQSTHKFAFALAICWVIFASIYQKGFLESFLSWKPFLPLSKLVYLFYLVQLVVLFHRKGNRRTNIYATHYDMIYEFFGVAVTSFGMASILYILVEAPFAALTPIIFAKTKKIELKG